MKILRVLVVDDEPLARSVLREELEMHPDVEVVGEADNGAIAIKMIADLRPDLVFLDLRMPDMDGFAVLRRLQSLAMVPEVVVVTAGENQNEVALASGATDCLQKPVSPSRLLASLEGIRQTLYARQRNKAQKRCPDE